MAIISNLGQATGAILLAYILIAYYKHKKIIEEHPKEQAIEDKIIASQDWWNKLTPKQKMTIHKQNRTV